MCSSNQNVHAQRRKPINSGTHLRSFAIKSEKILHITVLSVRLLYRKHGLGQFLVDEVKAKSDKFDTLAVLADTDAISFFKKQNFTQDHLVCSRYEVLIDTWTDCVVMIHVPILFDPSKIENDKNMEFLQKDFEFLQTGSMKIYQQQFGLISQLKDEVIATRKIVDMQSKIIDSLTKEIRQREQSNTF